MHKSRQKAACAMQSSLCAVKPCSPAIASRTPQGYRPPAPGPRLLYPIGHSDFGRAVSRILSSPLRAERTICLSSQYPGPVPQCETWSGPLRGPLFGLAPDGVFRASALTLGAVGSYPTFSPLPFEIPNLKSEIPKSAVCSLWHFPSGCLAASPPACIPDQIGVTRHRALWCSDFPPLPK